MKRVVFAVIALSCLFSSRAEAAGTIDFSVLQEIDGQLQVYYGRSQFNRQTGDLSVPVGLTNVGALDIPCPLVLIVRNITDPDITVENATGTSPTGDPYFDLSDLVGPDGILAPGESIAPLQTVVFRNAARTRFRFDTQCLAALSTFRAIADCSPTSGVAPLQVRFRSRGEFAGGSIVRYRWDFEGDGNFDTNDAVATDYIRTFNSGGIFDAVLEVTNNFGEKATDLCRIVVRGSPPTVTADAIPSNGPIPLDVNFTGTANDPDGTIVLWEWDFEGDGTFDFSSPTSPDTTFTYGAVGQFAAVLRVTDNEGLTASARTTTTTVRPSPPNSPTVTASASPTSGLAPLSVSFDGSAVDNGTIVLWEWDFEGDGTFDFSSTTSPSTTFTYSDAGIFGAALRATDDEGLSGIDNVEIIAAIQPTLSIPVDTFDPTAGETAAIDTSINAPADLRLLIKDGLGTTIRTLFDERRAAGSYTDNWDGTDDSGTVQPQAPYFVILEYKVGNETREVDLTNTTGGSRFSPPRNGLPRTFGPFSDDMLEITFNIQSFRGAAEIQAFVGLFRTDTRFRTLLEREPLGVGTHTIVWDGLDANGNFAVAPPGDTFLFGIFGFALPDNAIMIQSAPELSNISVDPNFFDPSTGDFVSPDDPVATVQYDLSSLATVQVEIVNLTTGVILRTITQPNEPAGSGKQIEWDGRTDEGEFVDAGEYRLEISAIGTTGSVSLKRFALVRVFY